MTDIRKRKPTPSDIFPRISRPTVPDRPSVGRVLDFITDFLIIDPYFVTYDGPSQTMGSDYLLLMDIIVTEPQLDLFLRRRISPVDLYWIMDDVKRKIIEDEIEGEDVNTLIYDVVRDFIKEEKFTSGFC